MCCGAKRQSVSKPTVTRRMSPKPMARAHPEALRMGSTTPLKTVTFEYVGLSSLTAVSPITGKRYVFSRPGAKVEVDGRDRQALASHSGLKLLT